METLEKKNYTKSRSGLSPSNNSNGSPQESPMSSVTGSKQSLNKPETPKTSKYKVAMSALKSFGTTGGGLRFGGKEKDPKKTVNANEKTPSATEKGDKSDGRASVNSGDSDSENDSVPSTNNNEAGVDLFRNFSFTGLYQSNEIQVNVRWREKAINTKIPESATVSAAIAHIIKVDKIHDTFTPTMTSFPENGELDKAQIKNVLENLLNDRTHASSKTGESSSIDGNNPEGFLLGKKDRQNPGMRVWFNPKAPISMYSLKQGDELILQLESDTDILRYIVPPSDTLVELEYNYELTVQNAIKEMIRTRNLGDQVYGLYNPRIGMWLDGTKPLVAYYLDKQILEFRALANEFLVRISLPDFDQKIGIKVLPTFLVADVLSIITFQLHKRKLLLPRQGLYGLLTPSNNQWLLETSRIDHYETIKTETLVFKIQHELCNIKVNQSQFVQMLVGNTCTAGDILNLFLVNHALPLDQDYALYTRGGNVMLTEEQKIMDVLKDMTSNESIMIQMRPISVYISTPVYPGLRIPFDLDISRTLSSYVASISRKFGFSEEAFTRINLEGNPKELDTDTSIARIKIAHSTKLEVHWDHMKKVRPQLAIANSVTRRARETTGSAMALYSIDELIDMLTEPWKDQSSDFSTTFLLTFKKFISVEDLVRKLAIRYMALNTTDLGWIDFEAYRKPIEVRAANSIIQWIKKFPNDFTHSKTGNDNAQAVLDFVDEIVETDHPILAKQIRKCIEKQRKDPVENDYASKYAKDEIIDELTSNVVVFNCTAQEIAENLTIIENIFYTNINPSELLNQAWSKKDALVTAPGIVSLSRRFNSVASWIVQCILDMKTPKLRAERIGKIIDVAAALVSLHNYSSLMAIIAGLNKACITRLHETQKELSSKTIKKKAELETLMSALGSYKNYRASIHKIQPPCIPYIGTYLTDLTYIEDGNPDMIDGLINFSKWEMVAKVIREVLDYQQCPYQLKSKQEVCAVLYNLPETSEAQEKAFWSLSKKYEQSANK